MSQESSRFMLRAIELSRRGFPAPNPRVGCVIVKSGTVVGEGHHDHAGGPHAEIVALAAAGDAAKGAEVFCTLEPCNHFGRTPPCVDALISAGVASVTFAVADPNKAAAGGADRLRSAGIKVSGGLMAAEASPANRVFLSAMALGRPYVCLKAALSLDGFIALKDGRSRWITGAAAREQGHRLRAEYGAVLVGAGTVRQDDPKLTARIEGIVNQPVRVVLDGSGKLGDDFAIFKLPGEVVRVTPFPRSSGDISAEMSANGTFDLPRLLDTLWQRGITGVLVEGGAKTHAGFMNADLVDRLELFVAPKILGQGKKWIDGLPSESLEGLIPFDFEDPRLIGPDLWLSAERRGETVNELAR